MPHYTNQDQSVLYWLDEGKSTDVLPEEVTEVTTQDAEVIRTRLLQQSTPKVVSVTMRQARLALLEAGHYASVQTAINAIQDPVVRQASQIEWEYAATVDRDSSFTQGMANALGLTEQDMDNLFMLAWSK